MNIYEKMQQARVQLHKVDMKKSGNNKFAGYQYFELGDFLPHITRIFTELKLFSMIGFDPDMATLTIINAERPEESVTFTSPMSTAALKGCHDVQNLGAVQTYLRRYLYVNALEIVEHDPLDATTGQEASISDVKGIKQPPKGKSGTTGTPDKKTAKKRFNDVQRAEMIDQIVAAYAEQKKDIATIPAHFGVDVMEDLTDEQLFKVFSKVVHGG